jgi:hypothetical protein
MRHVDALEISRVGVELFEYSKEGRTDGAPSGAVEAGPMPIRTCGARVVKRVDDRRNLLGRKRPNKAHNINVGVVEVAFVDVEV